MRTIRGCLFVSLLTAVFAFHSLSGDEKEERLRLIRADVLKRKTVDGKVEQLLEGNVEFQQGKTTIKCNLASQFFDQDPVALIGNVYIYDDKQSLQADTVLIYQELSKQIAIGNVKNITADDTTTADQMTYFQKQQRVISKGNVKIVNSNEKTVLEGGEAEYLRKQDYGKVYDNPELVKYDSLGTETMRIYADTMKIYERGERTIAQGRVKIVQPEVEATCGEAEFIRATQKILLKEQPVVMQKNQTISGDTLYLFLKDSRLTQAVVTGHALAMSDADTLNRGKWTNKLTGRKMTFLFSDKSELKTAIIEKQATSIYHIIENEEYKGSNEVSGDLITLEMEHGQTQKVTVKSSPDLSTGKYVPPSN